jgi:hypothetical protein
VCDISGILGPGPKCRACEGAGVQTIPESLRIAVAIDDHHGWQLDLTSPAHAADPDGWSDDPIDDPPPEIAPIFAIGSITGPVLRYRAWGGGGIEDVAVFAVTDEAWKRFERTLDRLGVWSWRSPPASGTLDGVAWTIAMLWGRRRIEIDGVGSFPPAADTIPGPEWAGFLHAVRRLAGNRGFDTT